MLGGGKKLKEAIQAETEVVNTPQDIHEEVGEEEIYQDSDNPYSPKTFGIEDENDGKKNNRKR